MMQISISQIYVFSQNIPIQIKTRAQKAAQSAFQKCESKINNQKSKIRNSRPQ